MPRTYMRRPTPPAPPLQAPESAPQGPSITELARGAAPTAAQMGRRVDLPGEIREKMESSFGADFSGVRLFESDTVADAGAEAVAQGTNIAFAPGKLDFTSTSGQALLGHELSHVVSQARGESAGRGFLNDTALEARADRQGMLAAQGESAFSGPVSPVSVSAASAASGPIQAKKQSTIDAEEAGLEGKELPGYLHPFQRSAAKGQWLQKRQERKTLGERAQRALDLDTPRDIAGSERMRQNLQAVLSSANAMRGGTPSSLALSYLATGLSFGGREQWKEVGEEDPSDEIDQQEADGQGPSNQIDRMVSAFTSRDITQMAPYLIEDVRRINSSTQNYISDDLSSVFDALNSGGGMAAKHSVNLKALLDSLSAEQRAQLLNGEGENDGNKLSQTVLIMDEATSALDAKTEMDVVNAVRDRGITTIVVAHRLSTVRDCDEIIVMEHGRIIERGTHDELMAADGLYARLIKTE